ncbi:hypothetical protein OKW21_003218 [Catalinimonas alkaloidigena]|uniref:hypothetical protein n=1 Tax=Catalinimonas alkaloidigena TaxID=1075417 RepID=UPI002405E763|nr:hypothetical protein [Catalinimonas alkaloidigena]MDF9797955.1 hypothetical protein [Catalinimonas alkaloidigena]
MESLTNIIYRSGFFTTQRWLQGHILREIEDRLGFKTGRLSQGAGFFTAVHLPKPEEFEFAGYSQVASHHTEKEYGNINSPVSHDEKAGYLQRKMSVLNSQWSLYGDKRLIKVVPRIGHNSALKNDDQYPPGKGIPQWKIVALNGIAWREISFVSEYPNGQFIPDEGYTAVRYI